jgi:putative ABC transporter-associated repeat protein
VPGRWHVIGTRSHGARLLRRRTAGRWLAAALALSVAAAPGASAATRVVIADGHFDIAPRIVDGTWVLQVKDDTTDPPTWRDSADVVIHIGDQARTSVPDDPRFVFIGTPGSDAWLLPQAQQPGLPWPGWNTQDPSVRAGIPGAVEWAVTGVEGPGGFALFLAASFGQPFVLFDSGDPLPQSITIAPDTHAHGNWAFTAPGVYRLTMEMRAVDRDGRPRSAEATILFAVGDGDPSQAFPIATPVESAAPSPTPAATADAVPPGDELAAPSPVVPLLTVAVVGLGLLVGAVGWATHVRRRTARRGSPPDG